MRSTTPPTSRRTACTITPATWRWCARSVAGIPIVLASATPSVETEVNARRGRYRRLHLPERFGGQHLPGIEAIDLKREGPPRGRFIAPRLAEAVQDRDRARRAGAAVPQPPRLCAAHALPQLRPSARLPELRRLAGRSPLPPPARLPPLRLRDAAAGQVPEMRGGGVASRRSGPASSGWRRRRRSCFPDARILVLSSDLVESMERLRDGARRCRGGPLRHRHRHAARRQGASLPEAQSGRHRRRRSRARQRRSARRRAHVPAPASGGRPRRPRGGPRPRAVADASARASGDEGADRVGPRGVLRDARSSCAKRRTIRRSAGSRACSCPAPTSTRPKATPGAIAAAAPHDEAVRVLGPAEAPLALVRGRYRFRILVKAPRAYDLSAYLREWMEQGAEEERQPQARGGRRSAELLVRQSRSLSPPAANAPSTKETAPLERGQV